MPLVFFSCIKCLQQGGSPRNLNGMGGCFAAAGICGAGDWTEENETTLYVLLDLQTYNIYFSHRLNKV